MGQYQQLDSPSRDDGVMRRNTSEDSGHRHQNDSDSDLDALLEDDPMDFHQMEMSDESKDAVAVKKNKWIKHALKCTAYLLCWYTFSLSLTLYNKWMFDPSKLDFRFPLFATGIHQLVQTAFATAVIAAFPRRFNPRVVATEKGEVYVPLTWREYIYKMGPCGLATGGDIGMGNISLKYITVSFYTMVKSSSLGWVMIFGFMFRIEKPNVKLISVVLVLMIGVVMMVAGETKFHLIGFLLVLGAAVLSGLRWALTQLLLTRCPATTNPFSTIQNVAPMMALCLFLFALLVEGPVTFVTSHFWDDQGLLWGIFLMIIPGLFAFFLTVAEYALLQETSVITLSIGGIFKEILTIVASALIYDDTMSVVNTIGLVISLLAIIAYNWYRWQTFEE
ncbi:putative transporter C22E12.01 [Yarrowia sp. B02]|nr:putative transporter C22E12.01 [Yarrowia sp. B02]